MKSVFVSEIEDDSASAIVVVDAVTRIGDKPPQDLPGSYLELALDKVDGRWKVADVKVLEGGPVAAPAAAGAATSTTTPQPSE